MKIYYSIGKNANSGSHLLTEDLKHPDPYPKDKQRINICPAVKAAINQSYILTSPIDIDLLFTKDEVQHSNKLSLPAYDEFVVVDGDCGTSNHYGFQLKTDIVFWTDKKIKDNRFQIWTHDIPARMQTSYNNWYIVGGFLPPSTLTRPLHAAIQLRRGENRIELKRGQPLMEISFLCNEKVELIRKDEVPLKIWQEGQQRLDAARLCPYTFARTLFHNFL